MQVYEQSGIDATVTLTSTELGFDPAGYTHHFVGVSGLADPSAHTWNLEVKPKGGTGFYYVKTAIPSSGSYSLDAMKIEALRITFSNAPSAAALTVQAVARKAFISF